MRSVGPNNFLCGGDVINFSSLINEIYSPNKKDGDFNLVFVEFSSSEIGNSVASSDGFHQQVVKSIENENLEMWTVIMIFYSMCR